MIHLSWRSAALAGPIIAKKIAAGHHRTIALSLSRSARALRDGVANLGLSALGSSRSRRRAGPAVESPRLKTARRPSSSVDGELHVNRRRKSIRGLDGPDHRA